MYKKFFSFREKPFKLVPNPEYYYLSRSHEEAMAHLNYAISEGDGFVEITGEVGTGKTTLCRVFLENLDDQTEVAYIFNPKLGPKQLLRTIADELGIRSRADDVKSLIDALNDYLIRMKAAGKKVVLLVDEAQNLNRNVMEQLRLLSNLETNRSKLLQIILVGQPELGELLDSYDLRQLAQRITLSCRLSPLSFREVKEYIEHRIHVASTKIHVPFTGAAYRLIYRYSKGIPRLINIVCDRSLLTAFSRNSRKISGRIVRTAVNELTGHGPPARRRMRWMRNPATLLALILAAALVFGLLRYGPAGTIAMVSRMITVGGPQPAKETVAGTETLQTGSAMPRPRGSSAQVEQGADVNTALSDFLNEMDNRSARHIALESVLKLWGLNAAIAPELDNQTDDEAFFRKAAEGNGFAMLRLDCDFELLKSLDLPAILAVRLPDGTSQGFLTLRQIDAREVTLRRARRDETITVPIDVLSPYCKDAVYVPWRNFFSFEGSIPRWQPHEAVVMLKMHLKEIGYSRIDTSPYFDEQTEQAVKQLQERHGLVPDGIVGPLTKIVLFNENPALDIPHIRRD